MNIIDLFSGAGGLSLGLKAAGARLLACVEKNRDACSTHANHSSECEHFQCDIREVNFSRFKGTVDVVAGGPPCQPFSLGGLRKANKDSRDMIPEFIRCLNEARPPAFIMENVPGLITRQTRPYFDTVLSQLCSAGYHLNWAVLHSADYGVPQKRRRLFILGFRDRILLFPQPSHGPARLAPHVRSFDVIGLEPIGTAPNCPVKFARFPDLRPSPYAGQIYNGGGRPVDPKSPCHTILASSGGYKTHWIDTEGIAPVYHEHLKKGGAPWKGEVPGARRLSIEECARIQTFPPDLQFSGSRSSQYTQVGDAVPVVLARAVASAVFSQLSTSCASGEYLEPDWEVSHYQTRLAI
jgi:DNA (cytosine-5)-methyltransferase 1